MYPLVWNTSSSFTENTIYKHCSGILPESVLPTSSSLLLVKLQFNEGVTKEYVQHTVVSLSAKVNLIFGNELNRVGNPNQSFLESRSNRMYMYVIESQVFAFMFSFFCSITYKCIFMYTITSFVGCQFHMDKPNLW